MKNIKTYTTVSLVAILTIVWGVYAVVDTIIQNITGWEEADVLWAYGNRTMTITDGDLKFINEWGDTNLVGDYFSGYYYDPAFGVFQANPNTSDRVRISSATSSDCSADYYGYKLEWFSYSPNFGFVDFNYDANNYSYICIPADPLADIPSEVWGVAYSPSIGFQSLSGITVDISVDFDVEHDSDGRYIRVDWIVSSENNEELLADQFDTEVRILWELTKSTFRRDVHQMVYPVIADLEMWSFPDPYVVSWGYLWQTTWPNSSQWVRVLNNTALFLKDTDVHLEQQNNIEWEKTLVVEGGNIYITENIRNTDGDGILWIIALQKDGIGWNIYIDPSVTDIHAIMYADRSLISYDGIQELDGSTLPEDLANQLYIHGSVFSENTIWASQSTPIECPFYVEDSDCDTVEKAMKYDFNFLRKYILVQPVDTDGDPIGDKVPQFGGAQSYGDRSTRGERVDFRRYPIIIRYDSKVQKSPPPFFN